MVPVLLFMLAQAETRATRPNYFIPVFITLLAMGGLAWLIAAVLGFARARAFGPAVRWFALSAVCMIVYHLHFVLIGVLGALSAAQNDDLDVVLNVGAFFNLFVILGGVCAIMGFIRLTDPR